MIDTNPYPLIATALPDRASMPQTFCKNINMKWEYKTIKLKAKGFMGGKLDETQLDAIMNDLGSEGWELTAAFDTNEACSTRDVVVIFKRPKS